jgi:tetratricopeptide (TPR) repeat protein
MGMALDVTHRLKQGTTRFRFLSRLRTHDLVLIVLFIALVAERILNHTIPGLVSQNSLTMVRDMLLTVVQVVGLLLLLSALVTLASWLLFHESSQYVICPFECHADEKSDGRTVANLLERELHNVYAIHEKQRELEQMASAKPASESATALPSGASAPRQTKRLESGDRLYEQTEPEKSTKFDPLRARPVPEFLSESFADSIVVNIGGTTISVVRLLTYISQSVDLRRAEFVISGRVQRFGSSLRLVTQLETKKSGDTEKLEVWREIKAESEIRDMVRDLACQIHRKMSAEIKAKTWPAFSHYTRALEAYHTYLETYRLEDLDRAQTFCLAAAESEARYESLKGLCLEIAWAYYSIGQYSKTAALLKTALDTSAAIHSPVDNVELASIFNMIGVALVKEGDRIGSEGYFRRAIELYPQLVDAYHNLVMVLADSGWIDGVRNVLRAAEAQGLLQKVPPLDLGSWYLSAGLLPEALAQYRRSENAEASYRIAGILSRTGRVDDAVEAYRRAIELDPMWPAPLYDLAVMYADSGNPEQAIASYRDAIRLDASFVEAYVNLAFHLTEGGRLDEACMCLQRARDLDPQNATAASNLSSVLVKLDRYADALATLRVAIDLQPKDPWFHNQLGSIYRLLRRPDEALAEYQRSVELDPSIARLHVDLGDQQALMGRLEEAIAEYELAIGMEPNDALWRASVSALYRRAGRKVEAERHRAIALAQGSRSVQGEYDQACFEALCGNFDSAFTLLESALMKKQETPAFALADPDLETLKGDARFSEMLARVASLEAAAT